MKMIQLLCICLISLQSGFSYGQHVNESNPLNETEYDIDSLLDISIGVQDFDWFDTTSITFLTLILDDRKFLNHFSITEDPNKHTSVSSRIIIGNVDTDSCVIYPIRTSGGYNFFLLDDFEQLDDSLLSLSIEVFVNRQRGTYPNIFYVHPLAELNDIAKSLNSIEFNPTSVMATSDWYGEWLKSHPHFSDRRLITHHCSDLP